MQNDDANDRVARESEHSDHFLLERFRSGHHDAATKLYVRYASRLLALASSQTSTEFRSRFDPDDVVQSVFRTFFRRVSNGLYDVPPGDELWQLLLVLALNKIRKLATFHRAQKRDVRKTFGADDLDASDFQSFQPDQTPLQILQMVIDELLASLPDAQRHIVKLRMDGLDADTISQRTQRSKRTVERVLHDFRGKLSDKIDKSVSSSRL